LAKLRGVLLYPTTFNREKSPSYLEDWALLSIAEQPPPTMRGKGLIKLRKIFFNHFLSSFSGM
jgi:hypothetical protein